MRSSLDKLGNEYRKIIAKDHRRQYLNYFKVILNTQWKNAHQSSCTFTEKNCSSNSLTRNRNGRKISINDGIRKSKKVVNY